MTTSYAASGPPFRKAETFKTGAVICRKIIPGTVDMDYEALLFISEVPGELTDQQLEQSLLKIIDRLDPGPCDELIVRADVNATANEVAEQLAGLNGDAGRAKTISYRSLIE